MARTERRSELNRIGFRKMGAELSEPQEPPQGTPDSELPPGVERWTGDLKFVDWIEKDDSIASFLDSSLLRLKPRLLLQKIAIGFCLAAILAGTALAAITAEGAWMAASLLLMFVGGGIYLLGEFRAKSAWFKVMRAFADARFIERYELTVREVGETDDVEFDSTESDSPGDEEPVEYFALSEQGLLLVRDGEDYFFDRANFYEVRPSIPLYETLRPWRIEELTRQNKFEPRDMTELEQREIRKQVLLATTIPAVAIVVFLVCAFLVDRPLILKMADKYEPSGVGVLLGMLSGASLIRFILKTSALQSLWKDRANRIVCTRFEDGVTYEWLKESNLPWSLDGEPVPWRTKFPFPI